MSIKGSVELYVKIHNNREESYIILEKLIFYIAISLFCLIIFFNFTTKTEKREEWRMFGVVF
jgi:hypothetical protein